MALQITLQGEVKPDGTLELEQKIPMPAGRVLVTLQPVLPPPPDDPFWQLMEGIWAGQKARGHVPRSAEEVEAERQALRDEMEEEIQQSMQLQEECRRTRRQAQQSEQENG
jgi:hypothetical protein